MGMWIFKNLAFAAVSIFLVFSPTLSASLHSQIEKAVSSIEDLSGSEAQRLTAGIIAYIPGYAVTGELTDEQLQGLLGVINCGLFEEAGIARIGKVAGMGIGPLSRGTSPDAVQEIALVGFSRDITQELFEAAAEALDLLLSADVPGDIYRYAVSYAVYNLWSPENTRGLAQGIIRGKRENIPLDKLTLALIIRVDQGLGSAPISRAVEEEIAYIRSVAQADGDRARREAVYISMKRAVENGVPEDIAQDFYFDAVEENWSAEAAETLFNGLAEGTRSGLTPEKLALALIIRMEQDGDKVPADRIVKEEIEYVSTLESKRLNLMKEARRVPRPPEPITTQTAPSAGINLSLMDYSIRSFIGVPYIWGGESRNGTDCSGFTVVVYREQGLRLPRVSRQQYMVGRTVPSINQLNYGDLVFFAGSGFGSVSHVGIYVGEGRFAHASCSRGVTISSLNKRYYTRRYAGAKRIFM